MVQLQTTISVWYRVAICVWPRPVYQYNEVAMTLEFLNQG